MKRGAKPIPIPDDFKNYYLEQKKLGIFDKFIAQNLFISERTLDRWKQNLGITVRK